MTNHTPPHITHMGTSPMGREKLSKGQNCVEKGEGYLNHGVAQHNLDR